MSDDNEVTSTIKAVAELAKVVPIYQDAIQPAAKQVGKALETVTKAVHVPDVTRLFKLAHPHRHFPPFATL